MLYLIVEEYICREDCYLLHGTEIIRLTKGTKVKYKMPEFAMTEEQVELELFLFMEEVLWKYPKATFTEVIRYPVRAEEESCKIFILSPKEITVVAWGDKEDKIITVLGNFSYSLLYSREVPDYMVVGKNIT